MGSEDMFNVKIVVAWGSLPFEFARRGPMLRGMKLIVPFIIAFGFGTAAFAQEVAEEIAPPELSVVEQWQANPTQVFDAADVDLDALQYIARPIVVLANSPHDPMVSEQMEFLLERVDELVLRDVILILDTDPAANTYVRQRLRPRTFQLVLMDKDGRVHLRKPAPWDVREISRTIDKMPLRQQELGR